MVQREANREIGLFLEQSSSRVGTFLENVIPSGLSDTLSDPARYSLLGTAKRVRPALCYATSQIFGVKFEQISPYAAAIELVHTASLMHDDLPCIDDDDLRRGRPCCHKVYGEGLTLVAGDYLIARAFSLIATSELPNRDKLVALLAEATELLCEGQAIDIAAQNTTPNNSNTCTGLNDTCNELNSDAKYRELTERHFKKTGALIRASLLGPLVSLSGNEHKSNCQSISRFSRHLGLLFQIVDDILDVTSSPERLGKNSGTDARMRVVTYVSLFGVAGAREKAEQEAASALKTLEEVSEDTSLLEGFVKLLLARER